MLALWVVILFPLWMTAVFSLVFTAAHLLAGARGIARMSVLAPHFFPVVLVLPLGAVWHSDPGALAAWTHAATLPWLSCGLACGAVLYFGEEAYNGWRSRRGVGRSGMDGFVFVAWLAPLQSLAVATMEETIWRAFLIRALAQATSIPMPWAVVASAALFALHHFYFGWPTAAYKGLSAAVWGALYLLSGSLWVALAAHLCSDLIGWGRLIGAARRREARSAAAGHREAQRATGQAHVR